VISLMAGDKPLDCMSSNICSVGFLSSAKQGWTVFCSSIQWIKIDKGSSKMKVCRFTVSEVKNRTLELKVKVSDVRRTYYVSECCLLLSGLLSLIYV